MTGARAEQATYRRIAVPLDGTPESEHALRWAVPIAQAARSTIDLVHVTVPLPVAPELYGAPALMGRAVVEHAPAATQRLSQMADEIAKRGVRAEVSVVEGDVPIALDEHFARTDADLVVIARQDRRRLEHLLFGSVSTSLTRRAHIPVLIVRPAEGESVERPAQIRHVLLPFDGSPFAEQIVPHVAKLARLVQAEITLLGVVEPLAAMAATTLSAAPDEGAGASSPEMERVATALRSSGLVVHTVVTAAGRPAHAIVAEAEQRGADLIALTTHGRGALKRAVMGSVSEAVLRNSRLPVLVFRPAES